MIVALRKRLGHKTTTTVQLLSDGATTSEVNEWIPSGFKDFDRVLGGGWAVGRCSEVAGDEASGKSALGHTAIRECQRLGGLCLLLDFEMALDKKKIRNVGIDESKLIYISPETMEEGWEIVWSFLASVRQRKLNGPVLIVWDSIAAAIPKAEMEGKMEEHAVGAHARLMSKACRKASRLVAQSRAHLMWINQYRTKFGGGGWHGGGPEKETTGGRAVKFYASQRVACIRIKRLKPNLDKGTPPSGYLIVSRTEKCRLAPPHRETEWILDFKDGPSAPRTTLHLLREAKIVRPRGSGQASAPWLKKGETFRLRAWAERWKELEFRKGAKTALARLVAAGGVAEYLAARKRTEDDDEGGESDSG